MALHVAKSQVSPRRATHQTAGADGPLMLSGRFVPSMPFQCSFRSVSVQFQCGKRAVSVRLLVCGCGD
eukprot:3082702-Rhodomonas_salina.1